jgi:diguanylate cyclase (GGDEF)-like protein/PAS domain S-box-containing protein
MNLVKQIILPIAVLVAVAMMVVVAYVWFSAQRQDEIALEHSIDSVRDAILRKTEEVGRVAKDYSWWNDAARYLVVSFDLEWADLNIGSYLYVNFGYEMSFIVDGADATIYASTGEGRVERDAFETLSHGLDRLIEAARAAPMDVPEPATGLLAVGDEVVMVGASAITPEENGEVELPPGPRSVMIHVKRLDPEFLDAVAEPLPLTDLHMVAAPEAGAEAVLPLIAPDGTRLATLVWSPHRPGAEFLHSVAPSLGVAIAIVFVFTGLVLRHARDAARTIEASEARFRDVAEASSDWIWETDARLNFTYLSERFAEVTGVAAAAVIGRPVDALLHRAESPERWQDYLDDLRAWRPFRNLLCHCEDDAGQIRTLRVAAKAIVDDDARPVGYRGTATDITSEIEAQRRVQYLALHDSLTDLPNRETLRERVEQAVANVGRRGDMAAILCLDLDRFKEVNDTLGHTTGDLLIRACAERLQACVRETDTVARIGGDEFAIVQVGLERPDDTQLLCRRLLETLAIPFDLEGHEILITASIGVALIPTDGSIPAKLLQNADIALYRAKDEGRNTYRFFEPEMDARLQQRKALERDLRHALIRNELELHYQPKVTMAGRRLSGVEALVRWHHPERGLVPPGDFIGVAEETGLILPLGEWVLRTACRQATLWPGLQMAVNISPVQFKQQDVAAVVHAALTDSGLAPDRLELEITESLLMENVDRATAMLRALKDLGVQVAMDDFGTGYSSLSYLQKFPFDKIKIDRSFIRNLGDHGDAAAIVRAVISLGESLGMEICAEGVETADQLGRLERVGCHEVQGYYFGRPQPAGDFERDVLRRLGLDGGRAQELAPAPA